MKNGLQTSLLEKKEKPLSLPASVDPDTDAMQQYNHVINCYHNEANQVENYQLKSMNESKFYHSYWKILTSLPFVFLFELCIVIPFLGLILFCWQVYAVVLYFEGLRVYKENRSSDVDPFENMIFCPEICKLSNSINKFYEMQVQDLQGFVFNKDVMKNLKLKEFQGRIKFMVYTEKFWDYFYNYPTYRKRHVLALLVGLLGCCVQLAFGLSLFDLSSGQEGE